MKYNGDSRFGAGSDLGNGNFVLLAGDYQTIQISQLQPGVPYHFAIFEANGAEYPIYMTTGGTGTLTTSATPTSHPANVRTANPSLTSLQVYSDIASGLHLLVIGKKDAAPTFTPVDGQIYTPSWKWADGQEVAPGEFVIHASTWNAPTISDLTPNSTYHFKVFNYSNLNGQTFYYTADPVPTANGTTLDYARPQASNFSATNITHTGMTLNFTPGGGNRRIVVYKAGAPVDVHPSDGTGYGAGSGLGNGNFVAGYTTTGDLPLTGLTAGTIYHFAIYEVHPSINVYTTPPLTGSATTTGQTQTITFPDFAAKKYGDADFEPGATTSSLLTVRYEFSTPGYAEIVNGKIHILRAGNVVVTAKQDGDGTYAPATPVSKTLSIAKADLTVTAKNVTIPFGGAIPNPLPVEYSGFVNGENESALSTPPVLTTSADPGTPGTYTINISGATALNYAITHQTGLLTVEPRPRQSQTINFPPLATVIYGAAHISPQAQSTSGLNVFFLSDNPAVAQIVNGQIQIKGAGTANITANCNGDNTYDPAPPVTRSFTVNKAALRIQAQDKAIPQGEPMPVLTADYIGLVYGELPSVLTTPAVLQTNGTNTSPPGDYEITVTGATSPNYAITMAPGTFTVLPKTRQSQTITFPLIATQTWGATDLAPGATTTSPLAVRYTSLNPDVATIVNGKIHIVKAGTATIRAEQDGDNDYLPATPITRDIVINKAVLTAKADNKEKVYLDPLPAFTFQYTGFVNGDNVSAIQTAPVIGTLATASSPAGNYDITLTGGLAVNYTFNFQKGNLEIKRRPQTITFPLSPP